MDAMTLKDFFLLITSFDRSADVPTRRKYIELVERVQAQGGTVQVFSTLHVSGEQLNQLSGVAAILHFPLPDIEDEEDSSARKQEEDDDLYINTNGMEEEE